MTAEHIILWVAGTVVLWVGTYYASRAIFRKRLTRQFDEEFKVKYGEIDKFENVMKAATQFMKGDDHLTIEELHAEIAENSLDKNKFYSQLDDLLGESKGAGKELIGRMLARVEKNMEKLKETSNE